jgi:catechol 2,3-dioxygenase-like lactoylglutathione lyase family enzyme
MQPFNRRQILGYSAAALAGLTSSGLTAAKPADPAPVAQPLPTNPLAARLAVVTVVTPDMDASLHFYRDLLGYELARRGTLKGRLPTVPGVGEAGRQYAILHAQGASPRDYGALRLLEAPAGAAPNRPRPESQLFNPGLATFQLMTRNDVESYRKMTEGGAKTISPPQFYSFYKDQPMPGVTHPELDVEVTGYSVFGPAGEQMYSTYGVSLDHKPWPVKLPAGLMYGTPDVLHSALQGCSIMCLDRWPVWDFYDKAFGIKSTRDTAAEQDGLNTLTGLPPGTYFRFGVMGEETGIEVWEFRHFHPPGTVYPLALDRTGFAMMTLIVDDLERVRAKIAAAGIEPVGVGALPTQTDEYQDGLYLRGAVGELIEVIGRNKPRRA